MSAPDRTTPDVPGASRRGARIRLRSVLTLGVPLALLALIPAVRFLAPVAVRSHDITAGDVVGEIYGRGTVEARREAQVGFDLSGRVVSVLVDEGDRVTMGQELARLDPEQYEAELRTASLSVEAARAALQRLAAEQRQARTAYELAGREQRRIEPLVSSGVAPTRELDLARDEQLLARDELERVTAEIAEASRSVEVARGSAEQSRVTAVRATLLAPFDGYVARRFRDPGDSVAIGATVLRLVDTDSAQVESWIDENALGRITDGQPVRLRFPGVETTFDGKLVRIGKEADRQTHELLVDIEVAIWPPRFVVGQRVDSWIEIERVVATRLPIGFLRRDADGIYCYVDRGGRIARVMIEIGVVGIDVVEVLSGLEPGDVVLDALAPGGTLSLGRRWKATS